LTLKCSTILIGAVSSRILYVWIATNLKYDYNREQEIIKIKSDAPLKPEVTLEKGGGVCGDLADLYCIMCKAVDVKCDRVSGISKDQYFWPVNSSSVDWKTATFESVIGIPEVAKQWKTGRGHMWNIVEIDGGVSKLVDVTMGSGASNSSSQQKQNHFYYSAGYFNMPNEQFARSHYPRWKGVTEPEVANNLCWTPPATKEKALALFSEWITSFAPPNTMFLIDGLSTLDTRNSGLGREGRGIVGYQPGWVRLRMTFGCNHAIHNKNLEFVVFQYASGGSTKTPVSLARVVPSDVNTVTQNTYQFPTNDGQVQMPSLLASTPTVDNNPTFTLYVKHVDADITDLYELAEWRVIPII
jgi:hypothetical protein